MHFPGVQTSRQKHNFGKQKQIWIVNTFESLESKLLDTIFHQEKFGLLIGKKNFYVSLSSYECWAHGSKWCYNYCRANCNTDLTFIRALPCLCHENVSGFVSIKLLSRCFFFLELRLILLSNILCMHPEN